MHTVMHEFKEGTLHSGSKHGPEVHSRKQAIAIGMNEQRHAKSEAMKKAKRFREKGFSSAQKTFRKNLNMPRHNG